MGGGAKKVLPMTEKMSAIIWWGFRLKVAVVRVWVWLKSLLNHKAHRREKV